ncbi:response regulator transcription factor [Pantoea dispersa]|uniref:response regulator transcription factor n=1 Tax=Pantoea dispersa TaxID=59814 RepID=UPI002DBFAF8E|nr:response regulator transcription factor [Pantoea dispersa]MEB5974914.1 response regulator transcription factor [Pantoea dispersa]
MIIYDSHPLMVEGLSRPMTGHGYQITTATSDAEILLHATILDNAPLLVMDPLRLSENQIRALQENRRNCSAFKLMVYASTQGVWHVIMRLKLHAQGYVCKSHGEEQLMFALREVLAGKSVCLPQSQPGSSTEADEALLSSLTNRELQILSEVGAGKTNKMIADALELSAKTVSTYKRSIMQKMHTEKLCDVVNFAQRNGF